MSRDRRGNGIQEVVGSIPISSTKSFNKFCRSGVAFAEQTPRLLQGVRDAINARDAAVITKNAHALKGAVSNFAAAEIEPAKEEAFDGAAELLEAKLRDLEAKLDGRDRSQTSTRPRRIASLVA
jgi:HPt (histidine-containing phosphotransfer) domain-containing protein